MSSLIYRVKERGAHSPRGRADAAGSLSPHGPGSSGRRLGDLGRAALTSAGRARLLPAGPGQDTARGWVRRLARKQALNPWGQGCLQSGNGITNSPPPGQAARNRVFIGRKCFFFEVHFVFSKELLWAALNRRLIGTQRSEILSWRWPCPCPGPLTTLQQSVWDGT